MGWRNCNAKILFPWAQILQMLTCVEAVSLRENSVTVMTFGDMNSQVILVVYHMHQEANTDHSEKWLQIHSIQNDNVNYIPFMI